MISQAVILAAGEGKRLTNVLKAIPKGFLQFGEKPIIEESIDNLMSLGIDEIIIVTGHLSNFYDDLASKYSYLKTIKNSIYHQSGSLYSLYCARNIISDDFILLESDLIYEQRALTDIISHACPDVILISGFTSMGDEVLVEAHEDYLTNMSKDKSKLKNITGEFVGISKITLASYHELNRLVEKKMKDTLFLDYETDGLVLLCRERPIFCHKIENLIWCEIDNEQQYIEAKNRIYPSLRDE